MKKAVSLLIIIIMLATILSGCVSQSAVSDDGKLKIVCTLYPQYDFARSVVGNRAKVSLLLPPGTESHNFEPTPSDILSLKDADLFIYVGEEMETWVTSILPQLDKSTTVLNLSEILRLKLESHMHGHDDVTTNENEEETATGEELTSQTTDGQKIYDPHIWTSPVLAVRMTEAIRDTIIGLDKDGFSKYMENADEYILKIWSLDKEIRGIVADAKRTEIVFGSRFALRNFVEEYGLTYIAAFDSCTEETEPSAAVVAKIVDEIKDKHIPVVFYEELIEPAAAQSIAKDTGATPLLFHSCHNLSAEDFNNGETYVSLMTNNLDNLKLALS